MAPGNEAYPNGPSVPLSTLNEKQIVDLDRRQKRVERVLLALVVVTVTQVAAGPESARQLILRLLAYLGA